MRTSVTLRKFLVWMGLIFVLLTALSAPRRAAAATDALLEAKRKAAAQLLHDGKPADALALLAEVTSADDSSYNDHLLMARAYDKLGQTRDVVAQYRRVMDLLPVATGSADERAARLEADKRLKQMDPMAAKVDAGVEDILKKLDALERESLNAHSMPALERLFRLKGAVWTAEKLKGRAAFEVAANAEWQTTTFEVKERQHYRVRAAGTWQIRGNSPTDPLIECTAAGTKQRKTDGNPGYLMGQLQGQVNGKTFPLGEDVTFIAPASGTLQLIEYDLGGPARVKNRGALQVLMELQP